MNTSARGQEFPFTTAANSLTTTGVSARFCSKASNGSWQESTSRELSVKVFAGQCRLIEHGFPPGRTGWIWFAPPLDR